MPTNDRTTLLGAEQQMKELSDLLIPQYQEIMEQDSQFVDVYSVKYSRTAVVIAIAITHARTFVETCLHGGMNKEQVNRTLQMAFESVNKNVENHKYDCGCDWGNSGHE